MAEPTSNGQPSQVKLQLTTRQDDLALPEDTGPILVNINFRRINLSALVNHLLSTPSPIPLEFLINGQFLRSSLDAFLTTNGLSAEVLLTVEYVRAIVPPQHVASFQHDDWVGSVDVLSQSSRVGTFATSSGTSEASNVPVKGQERILSGGYDGQLRIWSMNSEVISTSAPDTRVPQGMRCITSARFITPTTIASTSYDRVVRVWKSGQPSSSDPLSSTPSALTPHMEMYGHKSLVNSLATSLNKPRLLTGSADHTLCLWSTSRKEAPPAPSSLLPSTSSKSSSHKRQKLSQEIGSGAETTAATAQRGPLLQLKSHTEPVTGVTFHPTDSSAAYSASHDCTVKTWDLVTGTNISTRNLGQGNALTCIEALQPHLAGGGLVAVGGVNRTVKLVDVREGAGQSVAMTLRGHGNGVTALSGEPDGGGGGWGLCSAGKDGSVRVWDLRSRRAGAGEGGSETAGESVYTIHREGAKAEGRLTQVFDVCWDRDVGIVSGGEDMRVQINKAGGVVT